MRIAVEKRMKKTFSELGARFLRFENEEDLHSDFGVDRVIWVLWWVGSAKP